MYKLKSLTLSVVNLLCLCGVALAQRTRRADDDAAACAACGSCGLGIGVIIAVVLGIIALNIALLVWVARDAKARGMDSAVMWMVLVMFTGLLGLVIYIFSRPQGNLVKCQSCGNNRLEASAKCPHCGNP
ncbi:MAG TPA: PLDc N-terminal domain-containing protein [Pyrinomonadaceae bacterium]|nr:PLDc N-terminal domain-containing protein [Pyrinomonadaceae bacterium]